MSKVRHTPGPWEAILDAKQPRRRGNVVASRMALVRAGGDTCIDCTHSGDTYDEDSANARLVAASPEMLWALELVGRAIGLDEPEIEEGDQNFDSITLTITVAEWRKIRAAIKKAKGEA